MTQYVSHKFEGAHATRCSWCGQNFNATIHVTGKEKTMNVYDDSQPVHAALSALIEDGYATDKQRATARLALSMIEEHEDEVDKELRRWQDAVRDKLIGLGAPDWKIDGAGCDSGDPLDFTLVEVGQGCGYFIDKAEDAATQMRTACVEKLKQIAADYDNVQQPNTGAAISKQAILYAARQLSSLTLDQVKQKEQS